MEELLKEFKEQLLNKEVSLVELDNIAQNILDTKESLFDYDIERDIYNNKSMSYTVKEDSYINVCFEILSDNKEDRLKTIVKITEIQEL